MSLIRPLFAVMLAVLALSACVSLSSSNPPPPQNTTVVVPRS